MKKEYALEKELRNRVLRLPLGLHLSEQAILARNLRTVTLHARVAARGFFESLGYTAVSEVFTEVTIPHIAMQKDLTGG
jgi:predicted GNAT family N-acyltransferase